MEGARSSEEREGMGQLAGANEGLGLFRADKVVRASIGWAG